MTAYVVAFVFGFVGGEVARRACRAMVDSVDSIDSITLYLGDSDAPNEEE